MSAVDEIVSAARRGDRERVRQGVARDASLIEARTPAGESPLLAALFASAWNVAELLLSAGARHDVHTASVCGDVVTLQALIDEDRSLVAVRTHDGWTPLHLAAHWGHPDAVRRLLEAGAERDAVSSNAIANQPLHAAAVRGQHEVVAALLDAGADANARAAGGYTPLHLAAGGGHTATVERLLAAGADRSARDDEGKTPADRAESAGRSELAAKLRPSTT